MNQSWSWSVFFGGIALGVVATLAFWIVLLQRLDLGGQ